MSDKTEVNCGLSFSAILKEIPPSNQIFVGKYGTHSHAMTPFSTKNGSKGLGLAFSSNCKWGVFYCLKKMIMVIVSTVCIPHCLK